MKFTQYEYKYTVQETDLDFLGHVNNANYVKFYEQARWQLIHDKGYSLKTVIATQQSPIILEVQVKYLKELSARKKVIIKTQLLNYEGKTGQLQQSIHDEETDHIYSEALITFGLFDMKERKLILPTQQWLSILQ